MSFLDKIAGKTRSALGRPGGSSTSTLSDAPVTASPDGENSAPWSQWVVAGHRVSAFGW
jgi:hypothetical protein